MSDMKMAVDGDLDPITAMRDPTLNPWLIMGDTIIAAR
jgi:hypothetical protein